MQYKVFGCKVNKYYTDKWLNSSYLRDKSGVFVASCVVTDSAKRKWVRFVKKALLDIELPAKVYISGCGAFKDGKAQENFFELYPELAYAKEKIEILDEDPPQENSVDIRVLLGTGGERSISRKENTLQKASKTQGDTLGNKDDNAEKTKTRIDFGKLAALKNTQVFTRKYVLIQGGCDSYCTFCLTVQKRGKHFFRSKEDIAEEIQSFADTGGKEAVVTGVNLAAWGLENTYDIKNFSKDVYKSGQTGGNGSRLHELISYILTHTTIPRLRISSLGPEFVTQELLDVFGEARIIAHFHYSIQSASSKVLARMARHYDGPYIEKLLQKTLAIQRKDALDISIGADIIVGFPGETQEDFLKSYELIRQANITKLHAFPFSPHTLGESVPAGRFPDQVPDNIKQERMEKILARGEAIAQAFQASQKGKIFQVLVEKCHAKDATWSGWTQNYIEAHQDNFQILNGELKKNSLITGILL